MKNIFFRLDEDWILVEQLRLLMGYVRDTIFQIAALQIIVFVFLFNINNRFAMCVWILAGLSSRLLAFIYSRRHSPENIEPGQTHRMVWFLIFSKAFEGFLWASLPWITLSESSPALSILVFSMVALIAGGAVAVYSPVLPVLIVFTVSLIGTVALKAWSMNESGYQILAFFMLTGAWIFISYGKQSSKSIRESIEIRFENRILLDQLRLQTEVAKAAQHEAEQANSAKSKFLAAASHDLRQPVHAQGLFLEVLSRTNLSEHQRELLSHSKTASEASSEMLNALLDFSRIEAGVIEPQLQAVNLQKIIHGLEEEWGPQADAKNIVLRTRETQLEVWSDPVLLEIILRNLVSNAIRYTSHGGVLIASRKRGVDVLVEIWDTGSGIDTVNFDAIFMEFHQLGNPERDHRKGLGLGLAIARGMADKLGHRLTLASQPGRGSVFRLEIPRASEARQIFTADAPLYSPDLLRNLRILVIEDDKSVREAMNHILQDWGCHCDLAENIEEAIELARQQVPDVIISDYRLREQRNGVEAIEAIHAALKISKPSILITGDTAPQRLREALAGGFPIMHKPVSSEKLYAKIAEVLNLRK